MELIIHTILESVVKQDAIDAFRQLCIVRLLPITQPSVFVGLMSYLGTLPASSSPSRIIQYLLEVVVPVVRIRNGYIDDSRLARALIETNPYLQHVEIRERPVWMNYNIRLWSRQVHSVKVESFHTLKELIVQLPRLSTAVTHFDFLESYTPAQDVCEQRLSSLFSMYPSITHLHLHNLFGAAAVRSSVHHLSLSGNTPRMENLLPPSIHQWTSLQTLQMFGLFSLIPPDQLLDCTSLTSVSWINVRGMVEEEVDTFLSKFPPHQLHTLEWTGCTDPDHELLYADPCNYWLIPC
jgi:hypothetical protein